MSKGSSTEPVPTSQRKLRAVWSTTPLKDIRALFNPSEKTSLSPETEITPATPPTNPRAPIVIS